MTARDERRIAQGVYGWLESPRPDERFRNGLTISGWAFVEDAPIVSLRAEGPWGTHPLVANLEREDVARAYPGSAHARTSGFSGYLECPSAPGRFAMDIVAVTAEGRTVRLFSTRLARPSKIRRLLKRWLPTPAAMPPRRAASDEQLGRLRRKAAQQAFDTFLASGSRLDLTPRTQPAVSVVVVTWNTAALTYACLDSVRRQSGPPVEVVLVDNASRDQTPALLGQIDGARIVRCDENVGFTLGANSGARAASGEFLLFLNSDAELESGAIQQLLDAARRPQHVPVGAVGGKLVFPTGRLQEAGATIWRDGSCEGYGRHGDPDAPEYNFERPVDYCSGALLLTPRALFDALGGFDERYQPGYYEDTDYCARLWSHGRSVLYQPAAVARHYEFGSAASARRAAAMQLERRSIFVSTHAGWLDGQSERRAGALAGRSHPHGQASVLVVDDAAPDPRRGAGFPRMAALVRTCRDLGYEVTIFTLGGPPTARARARFPDVEIVPAGPSELADRLGTRLRSAAPGTLMIVSRPHNMRYLKATMGTDLAGFGVPCLYDAEAIFVERDIARRAASGRPLPEAECSRLLTEEIGLARGTAGVLAVSDRDRRVFEAHGVTNVWTVGHPIEPCPTPRPPRARDTILFVGAFGPGSPNEDAARLLCGQIRTALARTPAGGAPIVVAGSGIPHSLREEFPDVAWLEGLDDLTGLYDRARVFVVPTRFAAGMPWKIGEAAAHGVPVVCTPLLTNQLGWQSGRELLSAETAADFAHAISRLFESDADWTALRQAALARVALDYAPELFRGALVTAMQTARQATRETRADPSASARIETAPDDSTRV